MISALLATTLALSPIFAAPAPDLGFNPSAYDLPDASRYTLDNGLTILLVPNRASPYLDIHLAIKAGAAADPEEQSGLSFLLSRMLTAGTTRDSENAFADRLALIGANLGANARSEHFYLQGSSPTLVPSDLDTFLSLFIDAALSPLFDDNTLSREKNQSIQLLSRLSHDAASLPSVAAQQALYGSDAWGRLSYGTPSGLSSVQTDDLRAYHQALFNPRHAVLAIGGDFEPEAMLQWAESQLGDLWFPNVTQEAEVGEISSRLARFCSQEQGAEARCYENDRANAMPPRATQSQILHIITEEEDLAQIPWVWATLNPTLETEPGAAALRLGTFMLGGDFTSRLNATLRTREGLSYGAHASAEFGVHHPGIISMSSDATPETLGRSLELAYAELSALQNGDFSASELESQRRVLINGFPFRFETFGKTLGQYLNLTLLELPLSWLAGWQERLAEPEAKDIQEAMRQIPIEHFQLIVAGPPTIAPILQLLPFGPYRGVTAKDLVRDGLP